MRNKFEVMRDGIAEYKSRMESAMDEWEEVGNGPISEEELRQAHALLKKQIVDEADTYMANAWWNERMLWKSWRKHLDRDLEKQFGHFREFNELRTLLRAERQKRAELLALILKMQEEKKKLEMEQDGLEKGKVAKLEEQIRVNVKAEEELARREADLEAQLVVMAKKYELKVEDKMDDLKTAKKMEKRTHLAHAALHIHPVVGLVTLGAIAVGTFGGFILRSGRRKKQEKKLEEGHVAQEEGEQAKEEEGTSKK